jgi:hypothetical protein
MRVFMIGVPAPLGGANVEMGHTALLWKSLGIDVTCLYFKQCSCGKLPPQPTPTNPWMKRLAEAKIPLVATTSKTVERVPGLAGSIVSGFCQQHAVHNWPTMKNMGCRFIHSPCMTHTALHENHVFRTTPPTLIHFQSHFQARTLRQDYEDLGCKRFEIIRGACALLPYRPLPHQPGAPFVVGRLARGVRTKWSPHLWNILKDVRRRGVEVQGLCQAWSPDLTQHLGRPPLWVKCLPPNKLSAEVFLSRCHAMVAPNWGVEENWPQVGLEAMSAGVPIVADASGGWPEMIEHAVCGYLFSDPASVAETLARLAADEPLRQRILMEARMRVDGLCNPEWIGDAWQRLLASV